MKQHPFLREPSHLRPAVCPSPNPIEFFPSHLHITSIEEELDEASCDNITSWTELTASGNLQVPSLSGVKSPTTKRLLAKRPRSLHLRLATISSPRETFGIRLEAAEPFLKVLVGEAEARKEAAAVALVEAALFRPLLMTLSSLSPPRMPFPGTLRMTFPGTLLSQTKIPNLKRSPLLKFPLLKFPLLKSRPLSRCLSLELPRRGPACYDKQRLPSLLFPRRCQLLSLLCPL